MSHALLATPEGSRLLSRVFDPDRPEFTPEAARSLLALDFTEVDRQHMDELAEKARAGSLTVVEKQTLDNYLFIGNILDIMHSRARLFLHRHAPLS